MDFEPESGPPVPILNDWWRLHLTADAAQEVGAIAELLQRSSEPGTAELGLALRLDTLSAIMSTALYAENATENDLALRLYGAVRTGRTMEDERLL